VVGSPAVLAFGKIVQEETKTRGFASPALAGFAFIDYGWWQATKARQLGDVLSRAE
jgi:hypothetical protein